MVGSGLIPERPATLGISLFLRPLKVFVSSAAGKIFGGTSSPHALGAMKKRTLTLWLEKLFP